MAAVTGTQSVLLLLALCTPPVASVMVPGDEVVHTLVAPLIGGLAEEALSLASAIGHDLVLQEGHVHMFVRVSSGWVVCVCVCSCGGVYLSSTSPFDSPKNLQGYW